TTRHSQVVVLSPENNEYLLNLCGRYDEHIRLIEDHLDVNIKQRGFTFSISGYDPAVEKACSTLADLYTQAQKEPILAPYQVHLYLQTIVKKTSSSHNGPEEKSMDIRIRRGIITARGDNQVKYIQRILNHDINFG